MAKNDAAADFILSLMHAQTNAHLLHLKSRSYAQHMALGALYEGLDDLTDSYAEAYQGIYGVIDKYPTTYTPPKEDPIAEVVYLARYIKRAREDLPEDTQLQNIVDEIAALVDTTVYKLRNLK